MQDNITVAVQEASYNTSKLAPHLPRWIQSALFYVRFELPIIRRQSLFGVIAGKEKQYHLNERTVFQAVQAIYLDESISLELADIAAFMLLNVINNRYHTYSYLSGVVAHFATLKSAESKLVHQIIIHTIKFER